MTKDSKVFVDRLQAAKSADLFDDSLWQHYKGGVYKVLGLTLSTEDTEVLVRYRRIAGPDYDAMYDQRIEWSRPLAEWFDDMGDTPRFWPVFETKAYISPNPNAPFFPPVDGVSPVAKTVQDYVDTAIARKDRPSL